MSHIKGRTLSLTLGCLLVLSGCVIHVHEKGEAEASTSSGSSGGEGTASTNPPASGSGQKPVADKDDEPAKPVADDGKPAKPAEKPVADSAKPAKPADKPAKPWDKPVVTPDKPADKPVADKDDKPAKPVADNDDKPNKPVAGKDDKPGAGEAKPVVVVPRPVFGEQKPVIVGQEDPKDPQRTEKDPVDKTSAMKDRPLKFDGKADSKKPSPVRGGLNSASKDAIRAGANANAKPGAVNAASDPVKGAAAGGAKGAGDDKSDVTPAQDSLKGNVDKGALAGVAADGQHSCKLFSPQPGVDGKVRLRVQGVDAAASVELDGKPVKVIKRDATAWVVQLDNDAKSGRLSLKHGELTVACGKLLVK